MAEQARDEMNRDRKEFWESYIKASGKRESVKGRKSNAE